MRGCTSNVFGGGAAIFRSVSPVGWSKAVAAVAGIQSHRAEHPVRPALGPLVSGSSPLVTALLQLLLGRPAFTDRWVLHSGS